VVEGNWLPTTSYLLYPNHLTALIRLNKIQKNLNIMYLKNINTQLSNIMYLKNINTQLSELYCVVSLTNGSQFQIDIYSLDSLAVIYMIYQIEPPNLNEEIYL